MKRLQGEILVHPTDSDLKPGCSGVILSRSIHGTAINHVIDCLAGTMLRDNTLRTPAAILERLTVAMNQKLAVSESSLQDFPLFHHA